MVGRGEETEQLRQRLKDGDWLDPGAVAKVLGAGRASVHRWLTAGQTPTGMRLRHRVTASGYREAHPDDVKAILAAREEIHGE